MGGSNNKSEGFSMKYEFVNVYSIRLLGSVARTSPGTGLSLKHPPFIHRPLFLFFLSLPENNKQ